MDTEIPVLAGYLNVPTQSGFSLNRISKKKSCNRYCLLFNSSRHGMERLEICESKEHKNPKIITLEDCVKITQEPAPANQIQIVKKTGTLTLNTLNDEDLKEWVNALQTVAFRDKSGPFIEENNDLYCSSFDGLFMVTLIPSDTSIRCNIDPKIYMLQLTATELQLKSTDMNLTISNWPYRYIRKYGYRDGKFTFEAGRKCSTGEGIFTLDHSNPQEIFRSMSAKMKSMKKLINGESFSSIDCVENQLSAAASMEAGSRSPLPPSPSNPVSSEFEMNSTSTLHGCLSSSDFSNFSSISQQVSNSSSPFIKLIPHKPPRKLPCSTEKLASPVHSSMGLTISDKTKKFQNYEPVAITTSPVILKPPSPEILRNSTTPPELPVRNESNKSLTAPEAQERDYECIETITDAWKTLGLNEIKHTERNVSHPKDNEGNDIVWQRSQSRDKSFPIDSLLSPKTHTIVDIDIGENKSINLDQSPDSTYDRLDFLSPNNKSSGGYKTIVSVSSSVNRTPVNNLSLNEYEIIASPDIQASRKADDAHLGYGILRKTNYPGINAANLNLNSPNKTAISETSPVVVNTRPTKSTDGSIDHQNYNGINYTIVSKPKRV